MYVNFQNGSVFNWANYGNMFFCSIVRIVQTLSTTQGKNFTTHSLIIENYDELMSIAIVKTNYTRRSDLFEQRKVSGVGYLWRVSQIFANLNISSK